MGDKETVMDMYTHFTHVTNELKSLGKSFTIEELVRKTYDFCHNVGKKNSRPSKRPKTRTRSPWTSLLAISKLMSLEEALSRRRRPRETKALL